MYYFDKAGYELMEQDDESLESYDWALISLFNALGIAMYVDCERDMREMFLWYQKYLDRLFLAEKE